MHSTRIFIVSFVFCSSIVACSGSAPNATPTAAAIALSSATVISPTALATETKTSAPTSPSSTPTSSPIPTASPTPSYFTDLSNWRFDIHQVAGLFPDVDLTKMTPVPSEKITLNEREISNTPFQKFRQTLVNKGFLEINYSHIPNNCHPIFDLHFSILRFDGFASAREGFNFLSTTLIYPDMGNPRFQPTVKTLLLSDPWDDRTELRIGDGLWKNCQDPAKHRNGPFVGRVENILVYMWLFAANEQVYSSATMDEIAKVLNTAYKTFHR